MPQLMSHHVRRQTIITDDDNCAWWYCSPTAYIVKWVVVTAICILILGFTAGGYYHAKRRMARGQAPLRYHRWLVNRRDRERFFPTHPAQNPYNYYRPGDHGQPQAYPMHNYGYAPPPPAYHEAESVPAYTPPSKVNPNQSYDVPPQGPPPSAYNPNASSSNPNAPGPSQPSRTLNMFNRNNK